MLLNFTTKMYLRLLNATVNATQNGTGSEAAKPLWHSCEQTQKLWGAGYNVFMIMLLLGFLAELIWCAVSFKEYMDNLKKDMDVKGYIYVLLLIALVSRVFWALDPHPNSAVLFVHLYRNTDAGAFINVITLKVTQIAALMAGTLMILIW